ncbi:peptidylprolyl isomerase [Desulfovibrio legallii]|jgi:hypothetical protein|uniref:PPIC-type PPIASE domain-containing protein n=1 Tax=Desulfovibrio legallii TaxID=571438 RepID=A0A1G7N6M4_9BACT|nr:peptidylprolyl isomerase [Desulfovibrio legallii]SDF68970.1 PPIC-type PPIASE domain-containing protein [Desulfovibrio legallii]
MRVHPAAPRRNILPVLAAFCCLCLALAGCLEARLPEGVVATVNGEAISLRGLQALLDSRSAALGALQRPSLESMRQRYGEGLGTLIVCALVRQDLQRRQLAVSPEALEAAIEAVRQDYGGKEALDRYLADEALDAEEWRALMRDHLSLVQFEKLVLEPGIRVGLDEVRAFYQDHAKDFDLPPLLTVCFVSGAERQAVEAFCGAFPRLPAAGAEGALRQCLEARAEDLPQPWRKAVAGLKPGQCAPPRAEDGGWRTVALRARKPAARLGLAEAYALVEQELREQKLDAAFLRWLEGALAQARIRVSPDLKADLLTPPSGRKNGAEDNGPEQEP